MGTSPWIDYTFAEKNLDYIYLQCYIITQYQEEIRNQTDYDSKKITQNSTAKLLEALTADLEKAKQFKVKISLNNEESIQTFNQTFEIQIVHKVYSDGVKSEDNEKEDISNRDKTNEEHNIDERDCNKNENNNNKGLSINNEPTEDKNNKKLAIRRIFLSSKNREDKQDLNDKDNKKVENKELNGRNERHEADTKDIENETNKPTTSNNLYQNSVAALNWKWTGKPRIVKRKGLLYKIYKKVRRGNIYLKVGDFARFAGKQEGHYYVGKVFQIWEVQGKMEVQTQWFYQEEETGCARLKYPGAVFTSQYRDVNDIRSVDGICEILSLAKYKEKFGNNITAMRANHDCFYIAGKVNDKRGNLVEIDRCIPFA